MHCFAGRVGSDALRERLEAWAARTCEEHWAAKDELYFKRGSATSVAALHNLLGASLGLQLAKGWLRGVSAQEFAETRALAGSAVDGSTEAQQSVEVIPQNHDKERHQDALAHGREKERSQGASVECHEERAQGVSAPACWEEQETGTPARNCQDLGDQGSSAKEREEDESAHEENQALGVMAKIHVAGTDIARKDAASPALPSKAALLLYAVPSLVNEDFVERAAAMRVAMLA
jgi:hypothetical protein